MMELEVRSVRRPIRQLRKLLKSLPSKPLVKDVQELRKRARRLETIITAYMPDKKKRNRRLMKTLKPVCKAAGAVRDMDVMATKARGFGSGRRNDSVTLLLEHLRAMRIESAGKLFEQVKRHGTVARRRLKEFSSEIEERFERKNARRTAKTTGNQLHADAANKLLEELNRWPALDAENLHAFRIKVKELRIVLQLAEAAKPEFADALEKVKDQIGDWHDWQQLRMIAENVLDRRESRTTLEKIVAMESSKLKRALAGAQAMRTSYLRA
jgi:CHAD domain-containing protein